MTNCHLILICQKKSFIVIQKPHPHAPYAVQHSLELHYTLQISGPTSGISFHYKQNTGSRPHNY